VRAPLRLLAGLLLAAHPAAAGAEAPSDALLAELPFLAVPGLTGHAEVIVDVASPGARAFPLQLDTGAAESVVTPRLARQLGVTVRRNKGTPYRRATRLGRDLQFWIRARGSDTASTTGAEFGVLGCSFLAEYVLEIDYPARQVRFLDPERFAVPETGAGPGEAILPLRFSSNRPLLDVEVQGQGVEVVLDSGAAPGLVLGGSAAQRAGLAPRPASGLVVRGMLGEIGVELAEAGRVHLGPFELGPLPVLVAPRGLYQQGTASDSVLGHDVLSGFVVRIDWKRNRVWLRRDPAAVPLLLGADWTLVRRSGARLAAAGRDVVVEMVWAGSAAERIGLQPGDLLDGVDATAPELDPETLHRRIESGGPLPVRRDGRKLELRLAPADP
jgi:predicted aspartyl protease